MTPYYLVGNQPSNRRVRIPDTMSGMSLIPDTMSGSRL